MSIESIDTDETDVPPRRWLVFAVVVCLLIPALAVVALWLMGSDGLVIAR
jgi:hypothetical protein